MMMEWGEEPVVGWDDQGHLIEDAVIERARPGDVIPLNSIGAVRNASVGAPVLEKTWAGTDAPPCALAIADV